MNARQLMSAISATRQSPGFGGHCVYCGCPCYGRSCSAHRDLTLLEQQAMRHHVPTPASQADGAGTRHQGG